LPCAWCGAVQYRSGYISDYGERGLSRLGGDPDG